MAYEWDQETMGGSTGGPAELEAEQQKAVSFACDYLAKLSPDAEQPKFIGTSFAIPKNGAADALYEAIGHILTSKSTERRHMISFAVRVALYVRDNGGGEAGWASFVEWKTTEHTNAVARRAASKSQPRG